MHTMLSSLVSSVLKFTVYSAINKDLFEEAQSLPCICILTIRFLQAWQGNFLPGS